MIKLGCYLLSLALLFVGALRRDTAHDCGAGLYVDGIRPSGAYGCRIAPRANLDVRTEVDDGTPDVEIIGAIYCAAGSRPVVVDVRRVGCR